MENEVALKDAEPNLHHIYNSNTRSYEVIDLNTGRVHNAVIGEETVPETYSLLMGDKLCHHIREGKTLREICKMDDMPDIHRFYAWLAIYPQLRVRYEQARKQRADSFHDQLIEVAMGVADKDDVPVAKLKIETLKWAAEKASPDYYGKKEEKVAGGTSISVVLHTGVLDSKGPKDIIIDEGGTFRGFGSEAEVHEIETSTDIVLTKERWEESPTEE